MIKQLWINLPVKDVQRSRDFFVKIGFKLNPGPGNGAHSTSLLVGDGPVVVMLFDEQTFKGFTGLPIADATKACEVLLSIDAQSKQEVDELVRKVVEAGGSSRHQPYEMNGPMYGCVFSDPDGHKWNVLYMDVSQVPR